MSFSRPGLNKSKCKFSTQKIHILGYIIDDSKIKPDEQRLALLVNSAFLKTKNNYPKGRSRFVSNRYISKYEKSEDKDCDLENDTSYNYTYADEFFDNRQEKERQSETNQLTPKQPSEYQLMTRQVHRPIRHRSPPEYPRDFK
ncbi:hypothetical protein GJ496_005612 [Pomphorhynchus laevis]|nr:hypothetical protein GJ496_005612 [Pomphorhynchus laevis]